LKGDHPHLRLVDASPEVNDLDGLMRLSLRGDERAYALLLTRLAAHLRAWFRKRLFDGGADAEDLVQETLLALHTRRSTYDPALPFGPWVHAIARYKLIDHLRRRRRRGVQKELEEDDLFTESDGEAGLAHRDVTRLLDQLPAKQHAAIRAVKIEELSVREAAERTAISEADVKVSVHRGLKKLTRLVRGEDEWKPKR
jgi:RNA polymerase sigma factor (sigma-70 family)